MRKEYNSVYGAVGEFDASEYLRKKGYKILEKNYKNNFGEIDIIAMDKKTIVFVEVKMRATLKFGRPSEAVDERKQYKIRSVASFYLLRNRKSDSPCRFDVIEVVGNEINHIENAF
jgi:putative endonuclease